MTQSIGFNPVARKDARVLILGTLPGVTSLKQGQYYANRNNGFWRIMGALTGTTPDQPYEHRLAGLTENGIALWDVGKSAYRKGSLDSSIRSLKPNDFTGFFRTHKSIKLICFNGQHAEKLFERFVMPHMPEHIAALPTAVLPSTSPAHASMRFEEKLARWRAKLGPLITNRSAKLKPSRPPNNQL